MKTIGTAPFKRAFTLVELLTVVGIIGILIAILIPALSAVRRATRDAQCVTNLHKVNLGIQLYCQDNKMTLPVSGIAQTDTNPASNWVFILSGFLNQGTDYIGIRAGSSLITVSSGKPSVLLCKQNVSNSGLTASSAASTYALNKGCSSLRLINATHPAQTALLVEGAPSGGSWPTAVANGIGMSATVHGNHSNVLYLDGHVGSVTAVPAASAMSFWNP